MDKKDTKIHSRYPICDDRWEADRLRLPVSIDLCRYRSRCRSIDSSIYSQYKLFGNRLQLLHSLLQFERLSSSISIDTASTTSRLLAENYRNSSNRTNFYSLSVLVCGMLVLSTRLHRNLCQYDLNTMMIDNEKIRI